MGQPQAGHQKSNKSLKVFYYWADLYENYYTLCKV